jgi:hypothetical protein
VTLLVALKGSDGLVLAADSRGTFGDPRGTTAQNDSQLKAHVLRPHVGLLMAGAGELGTSLLRQGESSLPPDGARPVVQREAGDGSGANRTERGSACTAE